MPKASARRQAGVARKVPEELFVGCFGPVGEGVHQQIPPDKGALPRRAEPAEDLFAVPPARGLLIPTLNAGNSSETSAAISASSVAILATSDPFDTFIAATSSAWVSTTTTESSGPKGSA